MSTLNFSGDNYSQPRFATYHYADIIRRSLQIPALRISHNDKVSAITTRPRGLPDLSVYSNHSSRATTHLQCRRYLPQQEAYSLMRPWPSDVGNVCVHVASLSIDDRHE